MEFLKSVVQFFTENWATILVVLLVTQNFIKGLRDALDSTPHTDDNIIEKIATIVVKVLGYLLGIRPSVKK
jgi:hypothetical protein